MFSSKTVKIHLNGSQFTTKKRNTFLKCLIFPRVKREKLSWLNSTSLENFSSYSIVPKLNEFSGKLVISWLFFICFSLLNFQFSSFQVLSFKFSWFLNYIFKIYIHPDWDSNTRPRGYKSSALTTWHQQYHTWLCVKMSHTSRHKISYACMHTRSAWSFHVLIAYMCLYMYHPCTCMQSQKKNHCKNCFIKILYFSWISLKIVAIWELPLPDPCKRPTRPVKIDFFLKKSRLRTDQELYL